jgi:hypothetical protein
MKIIVGVDYSMASPAICVHSDECTKPFSFHNCRFFFLTSRKRHLFPNQYFFGSSHEEYSCSEERYNRLSDWAIDKINPAAKIFLEGYAFGAKGQIFNIGENTHSLKHKIWKLKNYIPNSYVTFAPGIIKKFATGKGNANKILMYDAFIAETSINLSNLFGVKPGASPISDIVDAYYICKLGYNQSN